jgi:hypothetical protein
MNDQEFGYRIRQALDEGADRLDYTTVYRLEAARQAALASHRPRKPAPGVSEFGRGGWMRTLGLAAPVVMLIIGFIGIYEWQHQKQITDLANMDFAVLLDNMPIGAYADKSFTVLLQGSEEL